jgi:CBS domain containing-hemolysin-like protein
VMVPRTEMFSIESSAWLKEVFDAVIKGGHSRIPVCEGKIDNILGILYAKDLLKFMGAETEAFNIKNMLHQPYYVPETKNISVLLAEFRAKKIHMAIVVDEYGGTEGLVTLEDLLEEIVGEIQDEHDYEQERKFEVLSEDEVLAPGRLDIGQLNDELGISLPETEGVETLGGMIVNLLGRVPAVGEEAEVEGLRFKIAEATRRRIGKVKISGIREHKKKPEELS